MIREELNKRNLPDLFLMPNGKRITNREEWEQIARPYWRELILREEYGQSLPVVTPVVSVQQKESDFAGKATWQEVNFTFEVNGNTHTVPTQLIYPKDVENIPFFIYLDFYQTIPSEFLPVEEIIDNGFGVFCVCYNDVAKDNVDFTDGLAGLFQQGERGENDAGKLMYWAYMTSRMLEYLQTRKEVDKNAIGVAGHSRLGKTALLAGALDERFAFVCPNNSGSCGVAISRNRCKNGETLAAICTNFPFWFCPQFVNYVEKEDELPFDQHCLVALIAPRALYVGCAVEDIWADTNNQFLACVESSKAWSLYNTQGLIAPNRIPSAQDVFTDGNLGFHLREGTHYHSRTDWQIYMNAVKAYLQKTRRE